MTTAILLRWLPFGVIIIMTGLFMVFMAAGTSVKNRRYDAEKGSDGDYQTDFSRLVQLYEFLSRFPLTSKSTNQLMDIIGGLSMYNNLEQRVETARISGMSYLILIAIVTSAVTLSDSNLIVTVVVFVLAFAFRRDFVNKRLAKKRLQFWQDLLVTISSLQQEYERSKSIVSAFGLCQTEESTRYLMANIEYILKSSDPESQLTHFCNNNPFHICIRLAYLCYNTFQFSATYIEREGTDSFIDGLDSLIFDLTTEIDLAADEKKKFYRVEKLPLVGLGLTFIMPPYLQSQFPGLRFFYDSGIGFILQIITLMTVLGAYIISTRLNDHDRSQEDVTDWELRKFQDTEFSDLWNRRAGDARISKYKALIEGSLSYLTPEMTMLRKVIFGLAGFAIAIVLAAGYVIVERESLQRNYKTLPESALAQLETYYTDYNFVIKKAYSDPEINTEAEVAAYVYAQGWNLRDDEVAILARQVLENKTALAGTQFSILHLLIAFIVMVVCYNIPEIMLSRRAKMVRDEAKIEVLLLQSVICQLMHTPLKLKDYFIFFSSVSRLYMDTHLLCYVKQFNYPQHIKSEAYKMFNPQYYLIMEQLYTLHSSLKPAQIFRTTAASRRYLAAKTLVARQEALSNNFKWLSALLNAALMVPVVLQIVLPIASFVSEALQQYSSMMPQ